MESSHLMLWPFDSNSREQAMSWLTYWLTYCLIFTVLSPSAMRDSDRNYIYFWEVEYTLPLPEFVPTPQRTSHKHSDFLSPSLFLCSQAPTMAPVFLLVGFAVWQALCRLWKKPQEYMWGLATQGKRKSLFVNSSLRALGLILMFCIMCPNSSLWPLRKDMLIWLAWLTWLHRSWGWGQLLSIS